jgi:hypothetical protein
MTLDVEIPDPPTLSGPQDPGDYDAVDEPEAYGLAVMAGGQFAPAYENELSMGGGLYTADKAAERFGVKSTIVEAGA